MSELSDVSPLFREPHKQRIKEKFADVDAIPRPFDGSQFIGFLSPTFKINNFNQMILQFFVPQEYHEGAFLLRRALDVPLSVDVQLWKPYADDING